MSPKKRPEKDQTPEPGDPGYMAYIADLSASLGSLEQAFEQAKKENTSSKSGP
jgi:hypothetical protein